MKAKRNISKEGKRLESAAVEPSQQPMLQANEEVLDIDLSEFPALGEVNNILEKLWRPLTPSATDCEDEACWAYRKASALVTYLELADEGLDGDALGKPIAGDVASAIQLQVDIMRLAGKRLFLLCQVK